MTTSHNYLPLIFNQVTLLLTLPQTIILCLLWALLAHPRLEDQKGKGKGPTMDEIDEHFALLNTNIQQCVSSVKHGNQTTSELVDIACAQATSTQDVAAKIKQRNDLYAPSSSPYIVPIL